MFGAVQLGLSVIIITLILLQERSGGISGLLGGSGATFYQTRRGLEKFIFRGTVVLALVFIGIALFRL